MPPTQQGASLTLLMLPYRNPQSRAHLAATLGFHALIHMSRTDLCHVKEHRNERCIVFLFVSGGGGHIEHIFFSHFTLV